MFVDCKLRIWRSDNAALELTIQTSKRSEIVVSLEEAREIGRKRIF